MQIKSTMCTVDRLYTVTVKFMPILLAIILKALELVEQAAVVAVKPKRSVTHVENRLKLYVLRGYRVTEGIPGCTDDGWEYDDKGKEITHSLS